jgi:hypothetical protein
MARHRRAVCDLPESERRIDAAGFAAPNFHLPSPIALTLQEILDEHIAKKLV